MRFCNKSEMLYLICKRSLLRFINIFLQFYYINNVDTDVIIDFTFDKRKIYIYGPL